MVLEKKLFQLHVTEPKISCSRVKNITRGGGTFCGWGKCYQDEMRQVLGFGFVPVVLDTLTLIQRPMHSHDWYRYIATTIFRMDDYLPTSPRIFPFSQQSGHHGGN